MAGKHLKKTNTKCPAEKNVLWEDFLFLLLKIAIIGALLGILLIGVFGVCRCNDHTMYPACKDGDLAIYYRLQNEYRPSDVVIVDIDGQKQIRRVVATAGDEVEVTEEGLKINGYLQQEVGIYMETLPYAQEMRYPVTLGNEEYFVLGDNRANAQDSRIYGAVSKEQIKGVVMVLLRHRGI